MQPVSQLLICALALCAFSAPAAAQTPSAPETELANAPRSYVLGPSDQLSVQALEAEQISDKPVRIDMSGNLRLPMVGRIRAAGLTVEQLENEIAERLKEFVKAPEVVVSVTEFRSQPVSVIGSVRNPGVHQLQGRKTLIEILSLAGGVAQDAGHSVRITRLLQWGPIPLASAQNDPSGRFSVAHVSLKSITEARAPEENIIILPHDVISVPKAEMVYVTGKVMRSGGFVLNERETISVLQALSLAGGLDRAAAPQNSRILRASKGSAARAEITVDLRRIIEGKANDVSLLPDDILFIPASGSKNAAVRALEAAVQIGTGLAIYRR